nr:heat shock protein 90 [Tanacetum cinerariifolium]
SLTHKSKLDGQPELFINIIPDKSTNTLTIINSGVGMTRADLVVVTTKHNDDEQYVWESQVGGSFTVTRDTYGESLSRGTKMTLYLKEDHLEYLEERRLKDLSSLYTTILVVHDVPFGYFDGAMRHVAHQDYGVKVGLDVAINIVELDVVGREHERLHKGYDRFQTLLSQLEIHGAGVSHKDANQEVFKVLTFFMVSSGFNYENRARVGYSRFDDLYNNLRVFEHDVKGTTASSSSNTQNVAFVSADNTSSTNDINDDDLEEMDLKWQVDMISIRIKKFYKRTDRKLAKGNQDSRRKDVGYNGNKARDNSRRPAYHDDSKALVTIDGEDIDWSGHVEEDTQNYALMAYSSSNSGSDNEVKSCSKTSEESYARLKKLYDEQRDKLGDASIEITAYTLALKRLLNTQMSANDKFGLGYGDYRYGSILSYQNEVLQSVFMNKECNLKYTPVNDGYAEGMHAVPPPMTGNYMPSGPDVEIDYSKFTDGPKQTLADESDSKPVEYAFSESDSNVETTTSMPAPVDNAPKIVRELEVLIDAPIIEEYESDSDDDSVSNVQKNIEKPSFAFIDSFKHVKSPRENSKETGTPNHCPKIEK